MNYNVYALKRYVRCFFRMLILWTAYIHHPYDMCIENSKWFQQTPVYIYHWPTDNQTIPLVSISIVRAVPVYICIYNWINIFNVILVLACLSFPFRNQVWVNQASGKQPGPVTWVGNCIWGEVVGGLRTVPSYLTKPFGCPSIRTLLNKHPPPVSLPEVTLMLINNLPKPPPTCRDAPTWPGIQINLPFAYFSGGDSMPRVTSLMPEIYPNVWPRFNTPESKACVLATVDLSCSFSVRRSLGLLQAQDSLGSWWIMLLFT